MDPGFWMPHKHQRRPEFASVISLTQKSSGAVLVLASRVAHLTPSATLAISAQAAAMRANGIDVCSLSAGEPDFETPDPVRDAAIRALQDGQTRYGPVAGIPSLRQAISEKLRIDNHLDYAPEQVMVSNGGKQTLFNLLMVLLQPGDEVIIPAPYWVSYPEMVTLAGAQSVVVSTQEAQGFKLTAAQLEAVITPRSKLLVLNSPSNPTGAVYTRSELEALADVVLRYPHLYVVSDEIYEKLLYDDLEQVSFGSLSAESLARTITSNGFAKAFAMTGWRLGYLAGPTAIIRAAISLQSHSTSNVCTFAQYGALTALTDPRLPEWVEAKRQVMQARRDHVLERLSAIKGITCARPQGAFYVFPTIGQTGLRSGEFCQRLLTEHHVAGIPGAAFGQDDCVRLSYATGLDMLDKGLDRLAKFVDSLL